MQQWKISLERSFGRFGDFAVLHPWYVLVAFVLLYGLLIAQLPKLTADTSMEGYLRADDPVLTTYNRFREQFGRDELIIVAIESDAIFTLPFLRSLQKVHNALANAVPYLDSVDSLANARNIFGKEDELIVEDLLETLPRSAAQLVSLRKRVLNNPLYINSLISSDAKVTTVFLKLDAKYLAPGNERQEPQWKYLGDQQLQEVSAAVEAVVEDYAAQFKAVHIAGSPAFNSAVNKEMQHNTVLFACLTLLIIVALLLLLFRRASGVLLPLLLVMLSLSSTFASMVLFDTPFQLPMTILPSFILATGVGAAIHVLTVFYRVLDSSSDKRAAVIGALEHTGLAIAFTSATTAAGLCSFAGADLLPVANMGVFAALSMLFTCVYTVLLLPALIAVLPIRARAPQQRGDLTVIDRFTAGCAASATRYPLPIVLGSGVLLIVSLASALNLKFSHDMKLWFSAEHPVIQATDFVEQHFGGTVPLEVIVKASSGNALQQVGVLKKLGQLQTELAAYTDANVSVGKVTGLVDIVKETNQALHANSAEHYRLPQRQDLAAQEFFLLELSAADDLFQLVDTDYEVARTTALVPLLDAFHYADFRRAIEQRYREVLGDKFQVYTTGMLPLLSKTMSAVVEGTARSYLLAFFVIASMMIALLGSFKFGLLSMLPNIFPIIIVLGLMNIFSAPLDMFSMTLGAIALGLAVDDTVHFMHSFKRRMHATGDVNQSIYETLQSTGKALTITTVVIALSFFAYMFSDMVNLYNFGLYTGICIVLALLADMLLAPALMVLAYRHLTLSAAAKH